jgi:hypothetical protein
VSFPDLPIFKKYFIPECSSKIRSIFEKKQPKITMKQTLLWAMLLGSLYACQQKTSETSSAPDSTASTQAELQMGAKNWEVLAGTDPAKVTCDSVCMAIYDQFTVKTKDYDNAPGEVITVTDNRSQQTFSIDLEDAYFNGVVGNLAIIDMGTGNIREVALYDLTQQKIVTTIGGIVNDLSIKNGQLVFELLMDEDQVKALKLPECKNDDREWSGYTEAVTFDFATQKLNHSKQYNCVK